MLGSLQLQKFLKASGGHPLLNMGQVLNGAFIGSVGGAAVGGAVTCTCRGYLRYWCELGAPLYNAEGVTICDVCRSGCLPGAVPGSLVGGATGAVAAGILSKEKN